jgi:hypothetical protein
MQEQLPGLVIAYVGPNAAHRSLRAALANAKALAFVLIEENSAVLRSFLRPRRLSASHETGTSRSGSPAEDRRQRLLASDPPHRN